MSGNNYKQRHYLWFGLPLTICN